MYRVVKGSTHNQYTYQPGTAPKICQAPGCHSKTTARGLCGPHYQQGKQANDFTLPLRSPRALQKERQEGACIVIGCDRPQFCYHLCKTHNDRRYKGNINVEKPIEPRKTERPFLNYHGYMVVNVPTESALYSGRKVLQHRLVMARHLGRELYPSETIHHKNGIKTDNRLENLELWVGHHSHGSRIVDRLQDSVELICGYYDHFTTDQRIALQSWV